MFVTPAFPLSCVTNIKAIISKYHVTKTKPVVFCSAQQTVAGEFRREQ